MVVKYSFENELVHVELFHHHMGILTVTNYGSTDDAEPKNHSNQTWHQTVPKIMLTFDSDSSERMWM